MASLSVLIPSRNEMFLLNTIQDILKNRRGETNIIVVLDGQWPVEPIPDHPDVHLVYHPQSVGQRAATNEAARLSTATFVMKADAHVAFDEGFDVKLMAAYESGELSRDVTTVPRLYNLHVFDWKCDQCGRQSYQGPELTDCPDCHGRAHHRHLIWTPRWNRMTDAMRFDATMHFQYWSAFKRRPEAKGDFVESLGQLGACWMMYRDRYWELGGLDERHGSWGQMGTEISCKSWLSGGRQVINKRTWYSHLFRTQPGFGFPYRLSERQAEAARQHSRKLWLENTWEQQVRPLSWLIEKFWPVEGWTESDLARIQERASAFIPARHPSVGVVYYTDNRLDPAIAEACRVRLQASTNGHRLVSVSLEPLDFGENVVVQAERGRLTMFRQILAGLEALDTEYAFLCEHDCLYPPEHFRFIPGRRDAYYFNANWWRVDAETGRTATWAATHLSGCCASRILLADHFRKVVADVEAHGYDHGVGYEPGVREGRKAGIDDHPALTWQSARPYVDIRHGRNLTASRWSPEAFRDKATCQDWKDGQEIPGWGITGGRFSEWLREVSA